MGYTRPVVTVFAAIRGQKCILRYSVSCRIATGWCRMARLTAGKVRPRRYLVTIHSKRMPGGIVAHGAVEAARLSPGRCRDRGRVRICPASVALVTGRGVIGNGRAVLEPVDIAGNPVGCVRGDIGGVIGVVAFDTARGETCARIIATMALFTVRHACYTTGSILGNTAMP